MILVEFGWNFPSIEIRHEFGHKSYKKLLVLKLLFVTVFFTQTNSKLTQFLQTYVNNDGAEGIPQYREQIKLIKSKARKQVEKDYQQTISNLERDRDRYYKEYIDLKNQVSGLKNLAYQVRNIKAMSDDELKKI